MRAPRAGRGHPRMVVLVAAGVVVLVAPAGGTAGAPRVGTAEVGPRIRVDPAAVVMPSPAGSGASPVPALPACDGEPLPPLGDPDADWDTVLVDRRHPLPAGYEPDDLVDVAAAGFPLDAGNLVRSFVIDDLAALRTAAIDRGTPMRIVSAYRSHTYQAQVWSLAVAEEGRTVAAATTARAGHSEHQLGTTIDVLASEDEELSVAFGDTALGRWLADHAHEYGFVVSYPEGESQRACYGYEPWHLRYVGRELADSVHRSGQLLRPWLWRTHHR